MSEHETPESLPQAVPETPTEVTERPKSGSEKKLSQGARAGIIAAGIIAVLVLIAVIVIPLSNRGAGDDFDGDAGSATTPEEFVEGYLNALAEGDAEEAMTYVYVSENRDDLLTDEVLSASLELGAIDDIEVGEASEPDEYGDRDVLATFTVGGEEVSREFTVFRNKYDGDMVIFDALESLVVPGLEGMGLTANGENVPEGVAEVFPGVYELAIHFDGFVIDGDSTVTIGGAQGDEQLLELRPKMSEETAATFRELVTTSLRECLAMKTLSTPTMPSRMSSADSARPRGHSLWVSM